VRGVGGGAAPATVAEHWPGSSGSLRLIFKLAGWSSSGPA
jgi:hypothetical protein